jgi:hypothetical protein
MLPVMVDAVEWIIMALASGVVAWELLPFRNVSMDVLQVTIEVRASGKHFATVMDRAFC